MTLPKKDASWFVYITFPPHEHCWSYWGPVGCLWFSDWSMLNQHAHLLWRNHDNLGCGCFKEAWKSYYCVQVVGYTCNQRLHILPGSMKTINNIVCKWERWVTRLHNKVEPLPKQLLVRKTSMIWTRHSCITN